MAVRINNGRLDFTSNLDPTGFRNGEKKMEQAIDDLKSKLATYQAIADKTLNGDTLKRYNLKIQETAKEIERLKNVGKQGFDELGNKIKDNTTFLERLKAGFFSVLGAIGLTFSVSQLLAFGKELLQLGSKASGIERAFTKIGDTKYLEKLREETKGYVADLDLERLAVKANNFNIPVEKLGVFLSFAAQRAKDTGENVDKLTNNIIDGLGRKSARIIDNLGISIVDVQAEFKKTGDFTQAVSNLIQKEMNASGVAVETLADKTNKISVAWNNAKTAVADYFAATLNPSLANNQVIGTLTENLKNQYEISKFQNKTLQERQQITLENEKSVKRLSTLYSGLIKPIDEKEAQTLFKRLGGDVNAISEYVEVRQKQAKAVGEQLAAEQNIQNILRKNNEEANKTYRTIQGILSLEELRQKVTDKREEASNIVPVNSADKAKVQALLKEAADTQKIIDEIEGKQQKKDDKDLEREQRKVKQILEARQTLQDRLNELDSEYDRKGLSRDEEEVQALRDKFKKIAVEYKRFNDDPENKSRGISIDTSKINTVRDKAISDLTLEQSLNIEKKNIEEQKQIYKEYEDYKSQYGETAANERFKNEIGQYKSFIDYLKSLVPKDAVGFEKLNEYITKTALPDAQVEGDKNNRKNFTDILKENKSFQSQLLEAQEVYQAKRKKLIAEGRDAEANELDLSYEKQLDTLENTQVEKLKYIQKYNSNVFELTRQEAKAQLKVLEEIRKSSNLSDPQNDQLDKAIKNLETSLKGINGLSGKYKADLLIQKKQLQEQLALVTKGTIEWKKIFDEITGVQIKLDNINSDNLKSFAEYADLASQSFSQLSSATENISPGLSEALASMSKIADIASNVSSSIAGFSSGDVIGGITGAVGALSGVLSLFGSAKQDAEQRAYQQDLQIKQTEAINNALERQLALNKEIYGTQRLSGYVQSLKDIKAAQDAANASLSGKLSLTGIKVFDEQITKLNNGEKINELVYGLTIKQLKETGASADLAGKSLEELNVLLDQGKLDEKTAAIVNQLLALKDQYTDTFNAIRAETIGSTFDSQLDAIVSLFQNATTTAEDFAKNFQDIIQKSIINSFKRQFLEKQLQGFYEQFAAFTDANSGGSLDASEISQLQALYNQIIDKAKLNFDQLSQATGVSFGDSTGNTNSLKGSIKASLTEDTATILAGTLHGIQLGVNETNLILKSQNLSYGQMMLIAQETLDTAVKIEVNTRRTADNTDALPGMLTELKSINTTSSSSLDLLARSSGV